MDEVRAGIFSAASVGVCACGGCGHRGLVRVLVCRGVVCKHVGMCGGGAVVVVVWWWWWYGGGGVVVACGGCGVWWWCVVMKGLDQVECGT
jgi:hypothetical protein